MTTKTDHDVLWYKIVSWKYLLISSTYYQHTGIDLVYVLPIDTQYILPVYMCWLGLYSANSWWYSVHITSIQVLTWSVFCLLILSTYYQHTGSDLVWSLPIETQYILPAYRYWLGMCPAYWYSVHITSIQVLTWYVSCLLIPSTYYQHTGIDLVCVLPIDTQYILPAYRYWLGLCSAYWYPVHITSIQVLTWSVSCLLILSTYYQHTGIDLVCVLPIDTQYILPAYRYWLGMFPCLLILSTYYQHTGIDLVCVLPIDTWQTSECWNVIICFI